MEKFLNPQIKRIQINSYFLIIILFSFSCSTKDCEVDRKQLADSLTAILNSKVTVNEIDYLCYNDWIFYGIKNDSYLATIPPDTFKNQNSISFEGLSHREFFSLVPIIEKYDKESIGISHVFGKNYPKKFTIEIMCPKGSLWKQVRYYTDINGVMKDSVLVTYDGNACM